MLGLGNIGALAGKPVMEGKAVLFKKLSGVDAIDIEVNTTDVDEFCRTVRNIAPTFGGINLEDIKAPECFEIERRLKEVVDIPIMHDDQHGTAIISAAALLNTLEIAGKKIEDVRQQGRRSCGQDGLERIQARICNYQGSALPCRGGCKELDINALYIERTP